MADQSYTFAQARARLEEIVAQVRKKDISLEQSLDLLEEGVRLANLCTELSDHTEWRSVIDESERPTGDEAVREAGGTTVDDVTPIADETRVPAEDPPQDDEAVREAGSEGDDSP